MTIRSPFTDLKGLALQERCKEYLDQRTGTYEFRSRRYKTVVDRMIEMGLKDGHHIVDVGAGMCELDLYLRKDMGWSGIYVPVDGVIDGTNLETWIVGECDFFTCIEVLEHLVKPYTLMGDMVTRARKGVVITTPNPYRVDVLAMDETHITPIDSRLLRNLGWEVKAENLFGVQGDTLVAWAEGDNNG